MDIVERLRDFSKDPGLDLGDIAEAADEIERLRDAVHEAANNIITERYEPALRILEQAEIASRNT